MGSGLPVLVETTRLLEKRMITFVVATRNAHKVGEIRSILGGTVECVSLAGYSGAPTPIEDASTFAGNAAIKAATIALWLEQRGQASGLDGNRLFVLADDSGLEVDALGGAPGVLSARYAAVPGVEGNSSDSDNNRKLLGALETTSEDRRTARFRCALALVDALRPEVTPVIFEGACEGRIQRTAAGVGGFGYDPLFVPAGYKLSFAELGEVIKNQISHRSKALAQLKAWIESGGLC